MSLIFYFENLKNDVKTIRYNKLKIMGIVD